MDIKEELIYDFSLNIPRVVVCGELTIIDNVKRIVMFSDSRIIVHTGLKYIALDGIQLTISELREERMMITGEPEQISFFETL